MKSFRAVSAVVGVLLLAGCSSSVVDGKGASTRTLDPPCAVAPSAAASAASAAPSSSSGPAARCGPSPSPQPTASTSTATDLPARWAPFARTVYATPLGDPATLNLCAITLSADLTGTGGDRFTPQESADASSCAVDIHSLDIYQGQTMVVSVGRNGPRTTPAPTRTTVSGQTVLKFPYDPTATTCNREMTFTDADVTTTLDVSTYGRIGGGASRVCALTDPVIARFAAVAAGALPRQALNVASPSVLSVDACKAAAGAGFSSLPLVGGVEGTPTDYDTACTFRTSAGSFYVSAGLLRTPSAAPRGTPTTTGTHRIYDIRGAVTTTCKYASKQPMGELLQTFLVPTGGRPSAQTCGQVAAALGRYLDVLGLS